MKNGFSYHGTEVDALGGSFGKYQGELQYGMQTGNIAAYIAASGLHEGGWRDLQSSDLANLYGDIGWRGERGEVHVNVIAANNRLNGPGTSPVELLAVDPAAQFTAPNLITNNYTQVNLNANYRDLRQYIAAGQFLSTITCCKRSSTAMFPDVTPCDDGSGFLCESPGVFATDRNGNPIPDFLNGGPYSELDLQSTNTNGYGAALQATNRDTAVRAPQPVHRRRQLRRRANLVRGQQPDRRLVARRPRFCRAGRHDRPGRRVDRPGASRRSNAYYGAFFTDTFDITPALTANISGRYNFAQINLSDQIGDCAHRRPQLWPFQPVGRPDLEIPARCERLCQLCDCRTVRRRRPN